jgi:hypothetical protein
MKNDSIYLLRAINLCKEILSSDTNEYLSDTISLNTFNENTLIKTFKNIITESLKIDTLVTANSMDTLLIINRPIKELAEGLKYLAVKEYNSRFLEKEKEEPINLNKLGDPEYLKKLKEKLRNNVVKSLKEKSPLYYNSLSDEQIEKLVEEELQSIINYTKGLLEDIKKHPEKYRKSNSVNDKKE